MVIAHVSSDTPLSSTAQNLLIDEVNALRALIETPDPFVVKADPDIVNNSTSLRNDSELFLTLSDGLWKIIADISVTGPTTADVKIAWALSGGAAQATARQCRGPATGVTNAESTSTVCCSKNWASAIGYGTDGTLISAIEEVGLIQVTGSGTITMQYAQNSAVASDTTIATHSMLHARRVGD